MADAVAEKSLTPRIRWFDLLVAFVGGNAAGIALTALIGLAALALATHTGFVPSTARISGYLQQSFAANQIALAATDLPLLFVSWQVARRRMAAPFATYFPPLPWRTIATALSAGTVLSLVLNGGNELLERMEVVTFQDNATELALVPHGLLQLAVAISTISLLAPIVEEFFFRGLLLDWLRQRLDVRLAVPISAALFAAVHGQMVLHAGVQGWLYTIELFLAGLVLGFAAVRTGSLRASLALHGAYNLTATLLSVLLS